MARWEFTVTTALVATIALGVAGCGPADTTTATGGAATSEATEVVAALGAEGQALAALGFDADDLDIEPVATVAPSSTPDGTPAASPSGAPGSAQDAPRRGERLEEWRTKRQAARVLLRRGTLHGEAVVQTRDGGTRTVVVQRGEVTAIDSDSMTVTSTDGFTMTWTFGDQLRVVERRRTIQPDQVTVGTTLGAAGTKSDATNTARLIVIPR